MSTRQRLLQRIAPLLLCIPLLQCSDSSDPVGGGSRQIEGPLYLTGTLTTLAPSGSFTDVPNCPPAAPDPITFVPAGTTWDFTGSSALTAFALQKDPKYLQFILTAAVTINDKPATVTITIPDNVPHIDQTALGIHEGVKDPPYVVPADAFGVIVNLDTSCSAANADGILMMAFLDVAGSTSDVLNISEYTSVQDQSGNIRILDNTAFAGCFHAVVQNTYTEASVEKNSQICVDGCFRVRSGSSASSLTAPATPCGACAACP